MVEKRIVHLVALFCFAALGLGWSADAHADDWEVRSGDDRRQQIIERYQQMLEDNPVEGMALERLLGYVGRGAGLDQLISRYKTRVENSPRAVKLRIVLGHLLKARGDYDEAFTYYDQAVELDANQPLAWLGRGTVQLLRGERRAAMEDFEVALERESNRQRRQDILRQLGELSFGQREFDRGKEYFERLVAESPRDQYIRMDYVRLLVQYRQLEEAIEQYDELLRLAGRDTRQRATLLRDKADVYEMLDDHEAALQTYEEALGLTSATSWMAREIRTQMVNVYRQAGQLEEFIERYGRRWAQGANDQRMLVADVYTEMGKLEEALTLYRQLASRSPSEVEPRRKAIRVLERLGRDGEIAAAYRDLMRAAPRQQRFAFELAEYHMREGDREAAGGVLGETARRFRNDSYVLLELADYYSRWNFEELARQTYEDVLRRESDDDAVIVEVGDFFFDRGERQRAMEIWQTLPRSQLGQRDGKLRLAEILVERGIMTQGIAAFEELLVDSPDDERLLRAMARALERARRWDDALETWQRLLAVSDVRQRRQEARARIVELHQRQNSLLAEIRRWSDSLRQEEGREAIEAGFFLVESHIRLRDFDAAEAVLQQLREHPQRTPDDAISTLLLLEQTYVRSGRYREAIGVLEELIEERPDMQGDLLERMAQHALADRAGDEAIGYAARALDANPDDARAQTRLADVYRAAGDLEAAARHYRTATEIDHRAHDVLLKYGEILLELERWSEAETVMMNVVRNSNEDQLILDAGARLLTLAKQRDRLDALESQLAPLVFRLPLRTAHARLMFDLYYQIAGPLLLEVYHGGQERRDGAQEQLYTLGGRATTLLSDQLQSQDAGQRARALRLISEMEVDLATAQVARVINDGDDRLRKMAIAVAARLGSPGFIDALEGSLEDGDATIRNLSIWALGFIDDPRAERLLVGLASRGVEGTSSRLAWLGLQEAQSDGAQALIAAQLQNAIDQPNRDSGDMVRLLAASESVIRAGGGERFRESLTRIAEDSQDRNGLRAARVLASYDDASAAATLWGQALEINANIAKRGESGLRSMIAENRPAHRSVVDEFYFFDWSQGVFDAQNLLRRSERRWASRGLELAQSEWPEQVHDGLRQALQREGTLEDLDGLIERIAGDLRGERASAFWDGQSAAHLASAVLANPPDGLSRTHQLTFELLSGANEAAGEVQSMEDATLRAVLLISAFSIEDDGQLNAIYSEALGRQDRRVRQQALVSMKSTLQGRMVSEELAQKIIEAMGDDHDVIRLAAVRASGQLGLEEARPHLDALEEEAPPTLRRAVRQARRAL